MFTGLVEMKGKVAKLDEQDVGVRLSIESPEIAKTVAIGDSICISGCCLTVVKKTTKTMVFEAGRETLSRTSLGRLEIGSSVNLERSLAVGDRLGGHFVTGHIDCTGTVMKVREEGAWSYLTFRIPRRIASQIAAKGSITIDGVSLTVVDAELDRFSVALIPHTLSMTTLGELVVGDIVNLETDILAKYLERQLQSTKRF